MIRMQTTVFSVKLQLLFRTDLLPLEYLVSTDLALECKAGHRPRAAPHLAGLAFRSTIKLFL